MTVNIEGTSFSTEISKRPGFTCLSIQGPPASGKTTLALSAPGPIGYMDFDFNGTLALARAAEVKEIVEAKYVVQLPMPSINFQRDKATEDKEITAFNTVLAQFRSDFLAILKSGVRTVIWDSATELWEITRLAHFGRLEKIPSQLYAVPNADYRAMVREARKAEVNLILIHKVKDVWESVTRGESTIRQPKINPFTKETETTLAGMNDLGYLVEMRVETRFSPPKVDMTKPDRPQKEPGKFFVDITRADDNPMLVGTSWDATEMNFETLMTLACPQHNWGE